MSTTLTGMVLNSSLLIVLSRIVLAFLHSWQESLVKKVKDTTRAVPVKEMYRIRVANMDVEKVLRKILIDFMQIAKAVRGYQRESLTEAGEDCTRVS